MARTVAQNLLNVGRPRGIAMLYQLFSACGSPTGMGLRRLEQLPG